MKQSDLDAWEIRGLGAITRILGERLNQGTPYTIGTVNLLNSYATTLKNIVGQMQTQMGADSDPMSDIERMDRWFETGFANLVAYLEDRVKLGPEMTERHKVAIFTALQRAFVCVPIGGTDVPSST